MINCGEVTSQRKRGFGLHKGGKFEEGDRQYMVDKGLLRFVMQTRLK